MRGRYDRIDGVGVIPMAGGFDFAGALHDCNPQLVLAQEPCRRIAGCPSVTGQNCRPTDATNIELPASPCTRSTQRSAGSVVIDSLEGWINFLKNNPMQSRLAGEDTLPPYCRRAPWCFAAFRLHERRRVRSVGRVGASQSRSRRFQFC
jgi:hypothetical protein